MVLKAELIKIPLILQPIHQHDPTVNVKERLDANHLTIGINAATMAIRQQRAIPEAIVVLRHCDTPS